MSLLEDLLGKHHGRHYDEHRHHSRSNDWGGDFHQDGRRGWSGPRPSNHRDRHGAQHHGGSLSYAAPLLALAMRNKGIVVSLALLALILLVATIAVLVSLLPFLTQTVGFVGENGIKGVLEQFAPLLGLLWNGSGK